MFQDSQDAQDSAPHDPARRRQRRLLSVREREAREPSLGHSAGAPGEELQRRRLRSGAGVEVDDGRSLNVFFRGGVAHGSNCKRLTGSSSSSHGQGQGQGQGTWLRRAALDFFAAAAAEDPSIADKIRFVASDLPPPDPQFGGGMQNYSVLERKKSGTHLQVRPWDVMPCLRVSDLTPIHIM